MEAPGGNGPLGAKLVDQPSMTVSVTDASGYLSGDPSRIRFGFPNGTEIDALEILWPDGRTTLAEHLDPGTIVTITRGPE